MALQASAVMPQATHAEPSAPHAEVDGAVHADPAQQPPMHEAASQTHFPPMQA